MVNVGSQAACGTPIRAVAARKVRFGAPDVGRFRAG